MSRYNTLVTIHHNTVAHYLREVFKREWDLAYPHMPWNDDNSSLNDFVNLEQNKRMARKKLNNTGDRYAWDLTALFHVLLYSDSIGHRLKPLPLHAAIDRLRLSRNAVSHPSPSTYLSNQEFQCRYNEIARCLKDLGFPDAKKEMKDVVQQIQQEDCCNLTCGSGRLKLHLTFRQVLVLCLIIGTFVVVIVPVQRLFPSLLNTYSKLNDTRQIEKREAPEFDLDPSTFYFPKTTQPHFLIAETKN